MFDLEKLIRDRQDQLRGRPEDWIDRFIAWKQRQDWVDISMLAVDISMLAVLIVSAILASLPSVIIAWLFFSGQIGTQ